MSEAIRMAAVWLLIFWLALTVVCLRGYRRDRREARSKPPLTEAEKTAMAKAAAEIPLKEPKGIRWYVTHPKSVIIVLACLPFFLLFLPMVVLMWILPPPPYRR
ncbi:hypothetical protein [Prosthecobacter sp.]|jgi:hypothetical protein|uniref:hypothetical protein n=1 Tax=Prosthecobacter sp. TaxID=1965333 RepID=UPI0037C70DD3